MVELIWDGKYDADRNRVAPLRIALPFQTVETVNESAQQRQRTLDLFSAGRDLEWRNRLIWGDKKYVLPSLLPELADRIDLIYIDPPFATGADFSFQAQVGDEEFTKEPSMIEQKAYRDTWGRGLGSYMQWFYETAVILHELLSESGCIWVHCDWRLSSSLKLILDEVFGADNYQNTIVWKRTAAHNDSRKIGKVTDNILYFTKSERHTWNPQLLPYDQEYIEAFYRHVEPDGRRFRTHQIERNPAIGVRENLIYEYHGYTPRYGWMMERERLEELDRRGMLIWSRNGKPMRKIYLNEDDEQTGRPITDIWGDIPPVGSQSRERTQYPTQKPEALLERIIKASSNENDLVFDCFCGSGTTAAVAEKLNRRWVACDLGRFAIHTTRKRLLGIEAVRPFVVQNLGKYERQVWQKAEFGEHAEARLRDYRHFILDLYHAEPIDGYVWLHGRKGGRMVHVGTVDSPITPADVTSIAADFRRAIGTGKNAPKIAGVDILGWDFALDMNETVRQIADAAGLNVRFVRIPREVLETKAVEQGDIRFFELAALSVDVQINRRDACITLTDFMVPPDDVPEEVIKAVNHWSEWIDYWAVDFNYRDDTFHNEWQSYRTRKDRSLQLSVNHTYDAPGTYTVVVKVIDILGNDTTKAGLVEVR